MLWHCWLGDRKGIRPVKNWVLVFWWWHLTGGLHQHLHHLYFGTNKIQNGYILVPLPANPGPHGKWPLKRGERDRERERESSVCKFCSQSYFWGFSVIFLLLPCKCICRCCSSNCCFAAYDVYTLELLYGSSLSALTLLVGCPEGHPTFIKGSALKGTQPDLE